MVKKRVHGYDSFQQKIEEGIHEPGFIKEFEDEIDTGSVSENENENETDIDSEGEGEKVTDDVDINADDVEINTDAVEQPIDTGGREDITVEDVRVKMGFVNDQLKSFNNLLKNADNVPLDKTTKEKIVRIYNTLQGVS
jgi:hypothetical protein